MPSVIAESVVLEVYTHQEVSIALRSEAFAQEIESLRKKLTPAQKVEFVHLADKWCRDAYEQDAPWFMKIVRSKSNRGRDGLYNFIRHWFSAYCRNPEAFARKVNGQD